ncbi:MAG: AMP-binding protein [Bacteroidetes bacterium]|nr:AMP-binding protein [Bacteroidota bacterium]
MNICHILMEQAIERPEQDAIIEGSGHHTSTVTFAQLTDRSAKAAALLRMIGLTHGDRILLFQPVSIELYVALLAIFRLGLVATVLDPSAGRKHIEQCCRIAEPKAFLGPARAHVLRFLCEGLRHIEHHLVTTSWIPFAIGWSKLERLSPLDSIEECSSSHDALLTFTSGSTGLPKAAIRSHGFLRAQHEVLASSIDLEPREIDLPALPIFVLANLASGVTSVIPKCDLRTPGMIEPEPVLEQIQEHHITRTVASPAFYNQLLEVNRSKPKSQEKNKEGLASLRKLYTGGAPVFPPLLHELRTAMPRGQVIVVYGSTEAEPISHLNWDEASTHDRLSMYDGKGLLVGKPVSQIRVRIMENQWGKPLSAMNTQEFAQMEHPEMQPGEIVVSGPHVLSGYLNGVGDEETKFRVDDHIWHRTGDAGYLDPHGRLWLLGRASAIIQDDRGTVYPFAVECAASQLGFIRRSALASLNLQRLLAVELQSFAPADADQQIRTILAWAHIDKIVRVPRIPVDRRHNAKVNYPSLTKQLQRYVS